MDEIEISASELRAGWTSVLGVVAHAGRRVVVLRHNRVVGAFVGYAELERLRSLPPAPAPLTEHAKAWKRRDAMERHAQLLVLQARAQESLRQAEVLGDPLAIATARHELDELEEARAAALREGVAS